MLIGTDGMEVLARSQVAVFGLGGVGSHAAEALARGGVGKLFLADHDTVSLTNLNRQIIALHSTVGRGKAQVMKERIRDICPETEVTLCETFVLPENLAEVMSQAGTRGFYPGRHRHGFLQTGFGSLRQGAFHPHHFRHGNRK